MPTVKVTETVIIDAPIDRVWRHTADEFEQISRWDANVRTSTPTTGRRPEGASVAGRRCELYKGKPTVEQLTVFDVARQTFSYEIVEGLPGFVRTATNTWSHRAVGETTELSMTVSIDMGGLLGVLMKRPLSGQMRKVLGNAQEELKHYVELGQVHERKAARR